MVEVAAAKAPAAQAPENLAKRWATSFIDGFGCCEPANSKLASVCFSKCLLFLVIVPAGCCCGHSPGMTRYGSQFRLVAVQIRSQCFPNSWTTLRCLGSNSVRVTNVEHCTRKGNKMQQATHSNPARLKLQTDAEIVRVAAGEAADYSASCHEEAQSLL